MVRGAVQGGATVLFSSWLPAGSCSSHRSTRPEPVTPSCRSTTPRPTASSGSSMTRPGGHTRWSARPHPPILRRRSTRLQATALRDPRRGRRSAGDRDLGDHRSAAPRRGRRPRGVLATVVRHRRRGHGRLPDPSPAVPFDQRGRSRQGHGRDGILPLFIGLFLGIPLVAREIETGKAPTVWALVGARGRWLVGRLVPGLTMPLARSLMRRTSPAWP